MHPAHYLITLRLQSFQLVKLHLNTDFLLISIIYVYIAKLTCTVTSSSFVCLQNEGRVTFTLTPVAIHQTGEFIQNQKEGKSRDVTVTMCRTLTLSNLTGGLSNPSTILQSITWNRVVAASSAAIKKQFSLA